MRVFKTKWFSKTAKNHAIKDDELCLAKGGRNWFYIFLYAKQDMAELTGFRTLAKHYAGLKTEKLSLLIDAKELLEICHDRKREI